LENIALKKTVIPFKFGSVFKSPESVLNMLKEKHHSFDALLKNLAEKEEWGIKLFYQSNKLISWLNSNHEAIIQFNTDLKNSSPGKSFLIKKQKETLFKSVTKQEINSVREKLHEEVRSLAEDLKYEKETDPSLTKDKGINALNLPVLIHNANIDQVKSIVNRYNNEYGKRGFHIDLTGPWPPYNFV